MRYKLTWEMEPSTRLITIQQRLKDKTQPEPSATPLLSLFEHLPYLGADRTLGADEVWCRISHYLRTREPIDLYRCAFRDGFTNFKQFSESYYGYPTPAVMFIPKELRSKELMDGPSGRLADLVKNPLFVQAMAEGGVDVTNRHVKMALSLIERFDRDPFSSLDPRSAAALTRMHRGLFLPELTVVHNQVTHPLEFQLDL